MQRKKLARFTAVALAAIMTLGSAVTALASDVATSGSVSGNGTNEGHLDRQVVDVVLPVVSADSTMFAYTMDLERLIQETNHEKYGSVTFPAADVDTGVYFNVSGNYANTSEALTVTNRSSVSVNLTVEVEASEDTTDVTLVSSNSSLATADEAQLYLALKVGTQETPVVAGDKITSTVTMDGIASNFKVGVVSGDYVYQPIDSPAPWKTASFCLTGAASEASAEGLTAPTLTVTWRYDDPTAAEGGIFYDSSTNDWWFGLTTDNGFTSGITLGAVKVNNQTIQGTVTDFGGEDWVLIKWSDYVAAGYDQNETEYDFTVVVNGKTYTAHYTYE